MKQLSLVIEHLIAADHERAGVFRGDFQRFEFSEGVDNIAGLGLFRQKAGRDVFFIDARGLNIESDARILKQSPPDFRAGCEEV